MIVHVIAPERLLAGLPQAARDRASCLALEELTDATWAEIEAGLAAGDALIAIGTEALPRLRPLWVDSHDCEAAALAPAEPVFIPLPPVSGRTAACRGLFIRPEQFRVYFGSDEMPRMELTPLIVASGADGVPCAYPAVWLKHFAPSLVGGRFGGANWYVFAFEDPLAALDQDGWAAVIAALLDHAESPLATVDARAHYATYRPGETVLVNVRLANRSGDIAAARLEFTATGPDGLAHTTRWMRRCLNGHEEITVPWEFPAGTGAGLWRIRVDLYQEDRFTYGAARAEQSRLIERVECAFVVATDDITGYPAPEIRGRSLAIAGRDGFVAGTHYYPSGSWFDWAWRDFRPEKAARDIAQMQHLGYSLVRVWIDPELDEIALRGFEAWLHLSAAAGIVSIICVFSQWVRDLSYPDSNGMTTFQFMGPADYNVYSVQLRNIEHQRRYIATVARRWRGLPNIIWNLANETQIVDPGFDQVDTEWFGAVTPRSGPLAGAAYFNRWADLMTEAVREAGASQPILRGYGFVMAGDCYLQNRTGDLLVWHHYAPPEVVGPCLALAHPGSLDKPLLQEEFGIQTFDEGERLRLYEGVACWAAAMGAAGACSYEWGVSWLARELSFVATPLKDGCLVPEPDPRWDRGQLAYSESWPLGSVGICPWAASFCFGSNYACTPFPTPAAEALGEVARFCAEIGPPTGREPVILVVPMEWADFAPHEGYQRQLDPTYLAVQGLAAEHIPFSVVQEDQLPNLPDTPEAIIFPASQAVKSETQTLLEQLATGGAEVHIGQPDLSAPGLARHAIQVTSAKPVWCLRRGTRYGALYFLYSPEGTTSVTVQADNAVLELHIRRYALVEVFRDGTVRTYIGKAG